MMKHFTADHHFNHGTLARIRGISSTALMNKILIGAWNATVRPGDIVYHLGDLMFPLNTAGGCGDPPEDILDQLNGQIILVMGNHDRKNKDLLKGHKKIAKICDMEYVKIGKSNQKVSLCHYPMITWRASCHGSWSLHGHSHGNLEEFPGLRLDVGVDTKLGFFPYSEWDIIGIMKDMEKNYENIDAK